VTLVNGDTLSELSILGNDHKVLYVCSHAYESIRAWSFLRSYSGLAVRIEA